jgi:diguanylate cyclase (GGDEF)-like protein/PAS domain S-box-containing protein
MGYKGRVVAILFLIFCKFIFIILDSEKLADISSMEIYLSILLLIPMYFFGLQYDKAKYYSKEITDIFENGQIMLWKWERGNNRAIVSSGCEQIYGYSSRAFQQDEFLWLKVVYNEDKKIAEEFQRVTLEGKSYSSQYRIVHKNGKIKWIQNMASPVFDQNGKFMKLNGATIDITKQKEKDINYKKLIEASPVANLIVKDGEILYLNSEGLKLIGAKSLDDIKGRKLSSFLSAEQYDLSNQRFKQLFAGKMDKLPFYEFKVKKLDGVLLDIESTAIKTIYDDEEAVLVVAKDITEDKKMKLKLKEAEEKYRSISEEALVGVYILEGDVVTFINKEVERILGYSLEEIAQMNVLELFVAEERERVAYNLEQMLFANINTMTEDFLMITKSGERKDIEIRSVVTTINTKKVIIGTIIDETNEKRAENELKKALKELQDIKFALDEAAIVSVTDSAGNIISVNEKFCDVIKYNRDEMIGKTHDLFIPDYDFDPSMAELWKTVESGNVWKGETKRKSRDGDIYWFDTTIVPILDENNQPHLYIGIQYDITEKIIYQQEVKYLAYHDSLTGLFNRNSLNKYIDDQLKRLDPNKDTLSILFIDFDRFKNINDTLGHKYGDLMLQKASEILCECVKKKEQVFRYGGDEFVIVLDKTDSSEAETISRKIIEHFSESLLLQGVEVFTTPSIGISLYPNDGENAVELLKSADMAMYFAKVSGKNNYKFFHASIGERASKSVVIERELRKAIRENQFFLYFQPKIRLQTNEIIGYESLIRWNHPELGMVPPSDFIPIAEETGLIVKLGEWVLEQACIKAQELNNHPNKELTVAINISVKQFGDCNFVKNSKDIIEKNNCKPSLLEFEITETVMQDVFSSIKIVKELKEMGIKISMDDFGTGYSNLSILSEMDIDILKIDRSFVSKMCENQKSLTLVKTIINMGQSLGFEMVAEGIETEKQLELLKQLNCDIGQGYYFSPPK